MKQHKNNLCPCPKSGAWRTSSEAEEVLERILRQPARLYSPSHVVRCSHGIYHLTSKPRKRYAKGKKSRDRSVPKRRN